MARAGPAAAASVSAERDPARRTPRHRAPGRARHPAQHGPERRFSSDACVGRPLNTGPSVAACQARANSRRSLAGIEYTAAIPLPAAARDRTREPAPSWPLRSAPGRLAKSGCTGRRLATTWPVWAGLSGPATYTGRVVGNRPGAGGPCSVWAASTTRIDHGCGERLATRRAVVRKGCYHNPKCPRPPIQARDVVIFERVPTPIGQVLLRQPEADCYVAILGRHHNPT